MADKVKPVIDKELEIELTNKGYLPRKIVQVPEAEAEEYIREVLVEGNNENPEFSILIPDVYQFELRGNSKTELGSIFPTIQSAGSELLISRNGDSIRLIEDLNKDQQKKANIFLGINGLELEQTFSKSKPQTLWDLKKNESSERFANFWLNHGGMHFLQRDSSVYKIPKGDDLLDGASRDKYDVFEGTLRRLWPLIGEHLGVKMEEIPSGDEYKKPRFVGSHPNGVEFDFSTRTVHNFNGIFPQLIPTGEQRKLEETIGGLFDEYEVETGIMHGLGSMRKNTNISGDLHTGSQSAKVIYRVAQEMINLQDRLFK